MKYILLLLFWSSSGSSVATAVFDDKPACEAAIDRAYMKMEDTRWASRQDMSRRIFYVCVPQGTEIP